LLRVFDHLDDLVAGVDLNLVLVSNVSIDDCLDTLQEMVQLVGHEGTRIASSGHLGALADNTDCLVCPLKVFGFLSDFSSSVKAVVLLVIDLIFVSGAAGLSTFAAQMRIRSPSREI